MCLKSLCFLLTIIKLLNTSTSILYNIFVLCIYQKTLFSFFLLKKIYRSYILPINKIDSRLNNRVRHYLCTVSRIYKNKLNQFNSTISDDLINLANIPKLNSGNIQSFYFNFDKKIYYNLELEQLNSNKLLKINKGPEYNTLQSKKDYFVVKQWILSNSTKFSNKFFFAKCVKKENISNNLVKVNFASYIRKFIYLQLMSSLDSREVYLKIRSKNIPMQYNNILCTVLIESCLKEKKYINFYSMVTEIFCKSSKNFKKLMENSLVEIYKTVHRVETDKIRICALFFSDLLVTNSISWLILKELPLNRKNNISSKRIFVKHLLLRITHIIGKKTINRIFKKINQKSKNHYIFGGRSLDDIIFIDTFFISIGLTDSGILLSNDHTNQKNTFTKKM